jgi:hypothetical protein
VSLSFDTDLHSWLGYADRNSIVAYWANETKTLDDFLLDLSNCKDLLEKAPQRCGLFLHNSYHFAVTFLALTLSGRSPILPMGPQQDRLEALANKVDHWILEPLPYGRENSLGSSAESVTTFSWDPDIQVSLQTSGSSGVPKVINKKLQALLLEVESLEQTFGTYCTPHTHCFATVPHYHIYGLLFKVLWSLRAGRSFNGDTTFTLEAFRERAQREKGGLLISCPAHLDRLPEGLKDLTLTFDLAFSSGGPLPQRRPSGGQNAVCLH